MHPLIAMVAKENPKLGKLDFGCFRMPFIENGGRKILPPKENLVRLQQDAAAVGKAPHPPHPLRLRFTSSFSHTNHRALKLPREPLTKNLIPPPGFKVQKADP